MADALEEAGEVGGAASLAKDLFSGAVGGIAQVLIGKKRTLDLLTSILTMGFLYHLLSGKYDCKHQD